MADAFHLLRMYDDDDDMSPEPEEGHIFGEQPSGSFPEVRQRTLIGNVQSMTPKDVVDSPQLSAQADVPRLDMVNNAVKDSDTEVLDGVDVSDGDRKNIDALDSFLPPPPQENCLDELQEKFKKFLAYKRQGKSFNVEVRNRKDYRNPDFLRHAVRYQDIDEIGSCFSKNVFDPHGYDESDFYDAVEAVVGVTPKAMLPNPDNKSDVKLRRDDPSDRKADKRDLEQW